jgi:hypothetical protein
MTRSAEPARPAPRGQERGSGGATFAHSATTAMALHPLATAALIGAGALGLLAARRR